jgi:hypothetical protein
MHRIKSVVGELTIFEILGYVTLLQLWWIAIWGIAYIGIEFVAKKSKLIEFYIYCGLLTFVIVLLLSNPELVYHL